MPDDPLDSNTLARLKEFSLTHPLVRNLMVSADGRHTLITATVPSEPQSADAQRALRGEIDTVLEPFRAEGLRFTVLALPLVEEEVRRTLGADLRRFVPAALGLLLAILWLAFRSWRLLLLVLITVFAVFWCSSFPPVVHFGLLSAAAFLGGLGGVLVFLPAGLCRWPTR